MYKVFKRKFTFLNFIPIISLNSFNSTNSLIFIKCYSIIVTIQLITVLKTINIFLILTLIHYIRIYINNLHTIFGLLGLNK